MVTTSTEMSGYKHYYFIVRGRGEIFRLALAAANIDFEGIRMNRKQWAKEKAIEKLNSFRYLPNTKICSQLVTRVILFRRGWINLSRHCLV